MAPRCPNGTRRNKKTGNCEPKNSTTTPGPAPEPTPAAAASQTKQKRCPKGTRRNKKTGNCESTTKTEMPKSQESKAPTPPQPQPKAPTPLKAYTQQPKKMSKEESERIIQQLMKGEADVKKLSGIEINGKKFNGKKDKKIDLFDAVMNNSTIVNSSFAHITFDFAKIKNSTLNYTGFTECFITNTDFSGSTIEDCTFEECPMNNKTNFKNTKLIGVTFRRPIFYTTLNFKDAVFDYVEFDEVFKDDVAKLRSYLSPEQLRNCEINVSEFKNFDDYFENEGYLSV